MLIRRVWWFVSKFKRFVAVLVLDKGYSVKQVALTAQIDEDIVRRWVNDVRCKRASKALLPEADLRVLKFAGLLSPVEYCDQEGGIPKNSCRDLEDEPDKVNEKNY